MTRTLFYIIGLLCTTLSCTQQPMFSSLTTSDGLSDNKVFHILQLHDGRIAATTHNYIDVWDGKTFTHIKKAHPAATPLTGYAGAYHAYTDKENRLWLKDFHKLWCYDANLKLQYDCLPDTADDVFVDDAGNVVFVKQDTANIMLDLKKLAGMQYRFYANGTVRCFDGDKEVYAASAPLDSIAITSLVVTDTLRHRFYQLIDQRLCLAFDTQTRQWTEVFRAEKLHTIALTSRGTAHIVSKDGVWRIELDSRKAERIDQVRMADGSYISSSRLNTIYTARDGTIWMGSYNHGLLYEDNSYQGQQYILYIIGGLMAFAMIILLLLWKRNKKDIVTTAPQVLSAKTNSRKREIAIDTQLIDRATALVQQNLATPNYTVERLAQDLCMDRTGLYKKMIAMIGKTPTAFIRSIRIEHAVSLIRESQLTMIEVAEQSGFSSASYMAKCFQEDLGRKPAEYRENQHEYPVESTRAL